MSPKAEIRKSPMHGRGMFARALFTPGEIVVVWGGTFAGREEAERARARGQLVMQLDDHLFSVEERGEDPTYFMNHSCDPDVWMADAVTLVARRRIASGEELTVDYALFEANEDFVTEWECVCDSPGCRRRITGQDWLLPEIQRRYRGHFSPLIAKRIGKIRHG